MLQISVNININININIFNNNNSDNNKILKKPLNFEKYINFMIMLNNIKIWNTIIALVNENDLYIINKYNTNNKW